MSDMSKVITPKSDQQNADDLIAGPLTIRVSGVDIRPGTEQPVSVRFDGDEGKPWKPCKSMCRIMVAAWGADAKAYVGRSMTLYRDPTVKWGGMDVGGIRISHMSDIDRTMVMALTATKGSRKPYTVKPLEAQPAPRHFDNLAIDPDALLEASRTAATEGTEAYRKWFGDAESSVRKWLTDAGHHEANKKQAAAADGAEG
jgi:hypothetical protein